MNGHGTKSLLDAGQIGHIRGRSGARFRSTLSMNRTVNGSGARERLLRDATKPRGVLTTEPRSPAGHAAESSCRPLRHVGRRGSVSGGRLGGPYLSRTGTPRVWLRPLGSRPLSGHGDLSEGHGIEIQGEDGGPNRRTAAITGPSEPALGGVQGSNLTSGPSKSRSAGHSKKLRRFAGAPSIDIERAAGASA